MEKCVRNQIQPLRQSAEPSVPRPGSLPNFTCHPSPHAPATLASVPRPTHTEAICTGYVYTRCKINPVEESVQK